MANIAVKTNTNVETTFVSIKTIFAMVPTIAVMVPTKIQNFVKVSHVTKFIKTNVTISNVSQDIMFAMVRIIVEMGLMKIIWLYALTDHEVAPIYFLILNVPMVTVWIAARFVIWKMIVTTELMKKVVMKKENVKMKLEVNYFFLSQTFHDIVSRIYHFKGVIANILQIY